MICTQYACTFGQNKASILKLPLKYKQHLREDSIATVLKVLSPVLCIWSLFIIIL